MQKENAKIKPGRYLINRAEAARKLGVSSRYINMLFRGERQNPKRLAQIKRLIRDELNILTRSINCQRAAPLVHQKFGQRHIDHKRIQNKKEGESL